MVGIKLLFRQPRRQVYIFHRSACGSQQICISAPHSSLRTNRNSQLQQLQSSPYCLFICDAYWRHFAQR